MRTSPTEVVDVRKRIIRIISRRLFPSNGNPRIMLNGSEERSLTCPICMGKIKEGSGYIRCDCNQVYHTSCLIRLGYCPYCNKNYEDLKSLNGMDGRSPIRCPLCGAYLDPGVKRCSCGAIFTDEGTDFCCPTCGTRIQEGKTKCPYCGELFESYRMVACPVCGQLMMEEAAVCSCGALLGNKCPGCGADLDPYATRCPVCNSEFEFI
jgi:uncharacterized Zn-finger protein